MIAFRRNEMPMSSGPWNQDAPKPRDLLELMLRIAGLVLCVVGLWQLAQGLAAAQNPAIPPAASWSVPAILVGFPVGVACLVAAKFRRRRRRRD
jgi:hypothetical protein